MAKLFIIIGSLSMSISVALGALGAHALKEKLSEKLLATFKTGVEYQLYHSLALIAVGILLLYFKKGALFNWSGYLFIAGILLFSGSLYLLALASAKWAGPITPLGGLSFIVAWLLLALAVWKAA